ncbi:Ubiquitin-conjugating enzyme- E2 [Apiospora kogelbergensis]|uniref:Ubiquitin-conjugating enzyme- E2 n=1 Tax=Apiospora kogelbergensis TaxID=1337665 RepID=UPI00312DDCB5
MSATPNAASSAQSSGAARLLQKQLMEMKRAKDLPGISVGLVKDTNIFEWEVTPVPFHPNIYPSGELCISILHPPEEDKYGYESASERWSPVQTPETILVSVISLFSEPNDESPANLDAAKLLRAEREGGPKEFRKRVRRCVRESLGED